MLQVPQLTRVVKVATLALGCATGSLFGCAPASSAPLQSAAAAQSERCLEGLPLSATDCARVRALALPDALPPAAGNRFGDDERAAYFGFLMFYDRRFSSVSDVSCASCHVPESAFADGKSVSEVVVGRPLQRNAPTLLNAARLGPVFFWDGRADSLWSAPLFAIENADEMASSRVRLAAKVYTAHVYRSQYEALVGPLPDLADAKRFPASSKPGAAVYAALAANDRDEVDRITANLGKMFEAYLRKMAAGRSKLDHYLEGDYRALGSGEKAGLTAFVSKGCIGCHSGPMLSDERFHKLQATLDRGRAEGIEILIANPFNANGVHFDPGIGVPPPLPSQPTAADAGAFRTPSLRNVALTAPFGHAGQFATLQALLASGHGSALDAGERDELELFLLALNGAYPQRPWSDWPAR